MTLKARTLGMTSTTYINASGLPAQEQITTARDQALLGRAIQHRFPGYYRYFATPSFHYKASKCTITTLAQTDEGRRWNQDRLYGSFGYNLVSSVRLDETHRCRSLGGTSNAARDARMRQLIEDHISQASTQRTVPIVVEANGHRSADRQWALYLHAEALRDRIARRYSNLDNFSGVIAPIDDVQNRSRI